MKLYRIILLLVLTGLSACATRPEQEQKPYLHESAIQFMQSGIENYTRYQYAAALQQFRQAREIYARYFDETGIVNAELNICKVLIAVGQYDLALRGLKQMQDSIERNRLQQQALYRDTMLSSVYLMKHAFDDAAAVLRPYDEWLLQITREDQAVKAALMINRVRLAEATGEDFDRWLNHYEQFISTIMGNLDYKLRLYRFKAHQAQLAGQAGDSNHYYAQALEGYRQLAEPVGVMSTLQEWADACAARNEWPQARERYQAVLDTAVINRNQRMLEQALYGLDKVFTGTGQSAQLDVIRHWTGLLKGENGMNELIESYDRSQLD